MSATLTVPAREAGVVRVFALSMTDAEAKALRQNPEAICEALGASDLLDMDHVELFPVTDLEGVGLVGYLADGAGIAEAQLAPDRAKLEKLGGWVLVVFSLAFSGKATTLRPAPALTLIGTYGEVRTNWSAPEAGTPDAAKPYTGTEGTAKKAPSNAAMSGRIATLVLILLGVFTYVFIRIAG